MNASNRRESLALGVLILLAGCYANNGGLLDAEGVDLTPSGGSTDGEAGGYPIGPAPPDGGVEGSGGTGGGAAGTAGSGGSVGAGGSGGVGATGGDPLEGEWQPPEIIEAHEGSGLNPHVAIGSNGEATAVWVQSHLGEHKVWTNRYEPASGWEGDTSIGTTDGNDKDPTITSRPDVVVDDDGVAMAAWGDFTDPILRGVVTRRYEAPGGWGAPVAIYDGASTAGDARLAVDGSGRVTAIFPVTSNVWASQFESGSGWTAPEIIDGDPGAPTGLQVALEPDGDGWAIWSQAPSGIPRNIYGNRLSTGAWGTADRIEDAGTGFGLEPRLALGSNGDALFIWQRENVGVSHVWTNAWDASKDELSEPIRLDEAVTAYAPDIAMSPSGVGVAVWVQSSVVRSGELDVATSRYTPGSGWSDPERLTTGDVRDEPRVAMDAGGNTMVVYVEKVEYEDYTDAWAQIYTEGSWGDPVRLGLDEWTGPAFQPSVAMAPNGSAVVVWREGPDIWAATFE